MSDLDFTGERLVPSKSPPQLEAEHRARYEFAAPLVKGLRVIDLGCGEGYGSHILSCFADSVVGVDIDAASIEHAKNTYAGDNLRFITADITNLPIFKNEFNACVCFEVIEHIANYHDVLKEITRILEPGGIVIISTPNAFVKVSSQPNPFHVKEFTLMEFRNLLEEYFPESTRTIEIYGQFRKGKTYSAFMTAVKNAYLGLKGCLGIGSQTSSSDSLKVQSGKTYQSEFRLEKPHLAEYFVAVIKSKDAG